VTPSVAAQGDTNPIVTPLYAADASARDD